MLKEMIETIARLTEKKINTFSLGANTYTNADLSLIKKSAHISPESIKFPSLAGLLAFVETATNAKTAAFTGIKSTLSLHIVDHFHVELIGNLQEDNNNARFVYAVATPSFETFTFGRRYDSEEFYIALQSLFVDTPARETLLNLISEISDEHLTTKVDDGFSQAVKVKTGLAKFSNVEVKNPIPLRPFQTFPEIEQPELNLILRFKSKPPEVLCALIAADGGMWKVTAEHSIAEYLAAALKKAGVKDVPIF